jgi:CubicO group peptidase (beta-lactamase class C family)
MSNRRHQTWAMGIVLAVVALAAVAAGLPLYVSATAAPLHPDEQRVPSSARADVPPQWSGAVERARQILRAGLAGHNLPGVSVAVGVGGDIVWAEGFGWADLATGAPVTPGTRFRIGTASTVLTSAAVGLLAESGRLRLDEEIHTYVPAFPRAHGPVTLRQVMGHTAGLSTDSEEERPLSHVRCERVIDALPHVADRPLLVEPGTEYRQSAYGWILASAAVEAAADQPFLAFMREQVFQPLGMEDTGAESATEENPDAVGEPGEDAPFITMFRDLILAPLGIIGTPVTPPTMPAPIYAPGWGRKPQLRYGLHVMAPRNLSCYAGSMAFFSTPSDLVRFALAMNAGTLLQPATVQLLQTSQPLTSGQATGHGLGWDLETVTLGGEAVHAAGYDGTLPGAQVASLLTFPQHGLVVAVTANATYADTSGLARTVADAFAE